MKQFFLISFLISGLNFFQNQGYAGNCFARQARHPREIPRDLSRNQHHSYVEPGFDPSGSEASLDPHKALLDYYGEYSLQFRDLSELVKFYRNLHPHGDHSSKLPIIRRDEIDVLRGFTLTLVLDQVLTQRSAFPSWQNEFEEIYLKKRGETFLYDDEHKGYIHHEIKMGMDEPTQKLCMRIKQLQSDSRKRIDVEIMKMKEKKENETRIRIEERVRPSSRNKYYHNRQKKHLDPIDSEREYESEEIGESKKPYKTKERGHPKEIEMIQEITEPK